MLNSELLRRAELDQQRRGNLRRSIEKRMIYLRAFARWMDERSVLDASKEDIERFLDQRRIGSTTRYAWISHLHCFYRWAIAEDLTMKDLGGQREVRGHLVDGRLHGHLRVVGVPR